MDYFFLYILIGTSAGTLSGMLGIGGGIIIIPFLIWLYKIQHFSPHLVMHMAAGTSLAIIVFNTAFGLHTHIKKGIQVWPIYKKLVIGMIMGTIFGATLAHFLRTNILEIIFSIFICVIAVRMLISSKPKPSRDLPNSLATSSISFAIGAKSGLLGVGGGAIIIPFLHYCTVPIRNIIAISAACSLTISTIGSISYMIIGMNAHNLPTWSTGYIYWPAFFGAILMGPFCSKVGAYYSHKLPQKILKKILGAVLLLMALKMLV